MVRGNVNQLIDYIMDGLGPEATPEIAEAIYYDLRERGCVDCDGGLLVLNMPEADEYEKIINKVVNDLDRGAVMRRIMQYETPEGRLVDCRADDGTQTLDRATVEATAIAHVGAWTECVLCDGSGNIFDVVVNDDDEPR